MPVKKATHQLTRRHNRDLVLQMIFENETISRAEIARQTMLTRTTVSEVVVGLLAEGLVEEVGLGSSIGGKPSILLSLVGDSRYLIGLNLTKEKFIGSIVNLGGEIQHTVEIPVPDENGQHALQQVFSLLDQLVYSTWQPVVGIGVGAPGLINTREGIIVSAVNLDWQDMPLASMLEERYHLPVSLLNDSQATAIGEFVYGDHASDSNLIVITVTHGVGAGILINGQIFQGDGGGAGEIGHIVVQPDGQLCRCGRRGCLETLAGARAVSQFMPVVSDSTSYTEGDSGAIPGRSIPVTAGINPVTLAGSQLEANQSTVAGTSSAAAGNPADGTTAGILDPVVDRFFAGDLDVRKAVLKAGHYLGLALGGLVGTFNIHKIVLTGDMTRFGEAWLEAVRETMLATALGRMTQETQVEIGRLAQRAPILGATAYLLLDGYSNLFIQSGN